MYRIKVDKKDGTQEKHVCKNYRHASHGLILEFEDKPEIVIDHDVIRRSWVGPADGNETNERQDDLMPINS